MKKIILIISIFLIVNTNFADEFPQAGNKLTLDHGFLNVGRVWQVVSNIGGYLGFHCYTTYGPTKKCEFPVGSGNSMLYGGAIIVAGKRKNRKLFSCGTAWSRHSPRCAYEFFPTEAPWDSVWTLRRGENKNIPYLPNHTAWTDQELVMHYIDYAIHLEDQVAPLYLDVIEIAHAWASAPFNEFILFEFYLIPTKDDLKDVWPAWYGEISLDPGGKPGFNQDNLTYYDEKRHMGIVEDLPGHDDDDVGPVGYIVFPPDDIDPNNLKWTFNNSRQTSHYDEEEYDATAAGTIDPPSLDGDGRANPGFFRLAFGPVDIAVGDTLHFMVGEIFGEGKEKFLQNADRLIGLKKNNFHTPVPPPAPDFRVIPSNHAVTINWELQPGGVNPENYTDPYRFDYMAQPFEGYRVYKSTSGIGGPWTLLKEYDVPGNDFFSNVGLGYEYTDVGLVNNLEYYYSVTAFSKPDTVTLFPSQESSIVGNAKVVTPGTAPPRSVGKVAVVPNPYRGDVAYYEYKPPWEKKTLGRWLEQNRRIQFINLPTSCEIKIYTSSGELVRVIEHEDPQNGFADWNLTSTSGQTVASGIYLFSVEDKRNGKIQVGKFIIIK